VRQLSISIIAALAMFGLSTLALADLRFQDQPSTTDNGTTLTVHGMLSGFTGGSVTVRVRATGTAVVQCAGHRRTVAVNVTGQQLLDATQFQDGAASFEFTTGEPVDWSNGCGSAKESAKLEDVVFRTATLQVTQDGRIVLRRLLAGTPAGR
jgi:hypothetical protein